MSLTKDVIQTLSNGIHVNSPIVRVLAHKCQEGKHLLKLSDGSGNSATARLDSQLNELMAEGKIQTNSIIRLDEYISKQSERLIIVVKKATVIDENYPVQQQPVAKETENKPIPIAVPNKPAPVAVQNKTAPVSAQNQSNPVGSARKLIPINYLNTYQNNWTIEGRVTQKSAIRKFSNIRGESSVFSFVLCDQTSDIRISSFGNDVTRFFDLIQVGKIYSVTKGYVKTSNKMYNNAKSDYEITLNNDSIVVQIDDSTDDIPKFSFNFVTFDRISEAAVDSYIDVIGVAHTISETTRFTNSRTNKDSFKREATLVDQSGFSVRLTVWGDDVNLLDDLVNPVIVVKGALVKEFNGRYLSSNQNSTLLFNPVDVPETETLIKWYNESGHNVQYQGQLATGGNLSINTKKCLIEDLSCAESSDKREYFSIQASITNFRRENFVYKGCTTEKCNKKLFDLQNGLYKCDKCDVETDQYNYRLILNMGVIDCSSSNWVTCFQNVSEMVLGKTAEEIGTMVDLEQRSELDEVFKEALYKTFDMKLAVKSESYNDETRMRLTVIDAKPIDYLASIDEMLKNVR